MTVNVDILDGLERKIRFTLPVGIIQLATDLRLKTLAKTVKMHGFRPGKVPLSMVVKQYGRTVQDEVMAEHIVGTFVHAVKETGLVIAGQPEISPIEVDDPGVLTFDALFEVYPEIQIGDLTGADVVKVTAEITEAAIDRTIEILRRQHSTLEPCSPDASADFGNRLTVDFEGKIDGAIFAGSSAKDYHFVLGEGQMLKEFEDAALGMKIGESKTFPLTFPEQYPSKEAAGKMADFRMTVSKIETVCLPDLNDAWIQSLGIAESSTAGLRANIRSNLERELKFQLLRRHKFAVFDVLLDKSVLIVPKRLVQAELDRTLASIREDLRKRGHPDADQADLPEDVFRKQAERTVRLRLIVSQFVQTHQLQATAEQVKAHIDEVSANYERPDEVSRWYFSDQQRLADVEAFVSERNMTEYVLSIAHVTETPITFDDLMAGR